MKRVGWTALVAALCAVVAVLWWRTGVERAQPVDAAVPTPLPPTTVASVDARVVAQESVPPSPDSPPPVQVADYAAQLRAASDYLEFMNSLIAAARAGDHAAQFYIFRALDYCAVDYRFYVDRGSTRRTLDDALKWAAMHWPYETETVRLVYARCHPFMKSAIEGEGPGPVGMAAKRQELDGVSAPGDGAAREKESRRLASMAIRSRDPAVIWEIADSPLNKSGGDDEPDGINDQAWFLAACQRGFDCSPQSNAVRGFCRYDQGCQPYESVSDIFRRANGNEYPQIEDRARWINEKIDAGDWEALGF